MNILIEACGMLSSSYGRMFCECAVSHGIIVCVCTGSALWAGPVTLVFHKAFVRESTASYFQSMCHLCTVMGLRRLHTGFHYICGAVGPDVSIMVNRGL